MPWQPPKNSMRCHIIIKLIKQKFMERLKNKSSQSTFRTSSFNQETFITSLKFSKIYSFYVMFTSIHTIHYYFLGYSGTCPSSSQLNSIE